MSLRTCKKCKAEKPESRFSTYAAGGTSGIRGTCKDCYNERCRAYRKSSPDIHHGIHLKRSLGISFEEYRSLVKELGDSCAICRQKTEYNICVDHNHATGKIRGLLCRPCNASLGLLGDDPDTVEDALTYLSAYRGLTPLHPEHPWFTSGKRRCSGCLVFKRPTQFYTKESLACRTCQQGRPPRLPAPMYEETLERARTYFGPPPAKKPLGIWSTISSSLGFELYQRWYEVTAAAQDGVCAVCRRPESRMVIDHCHQSGNIRGLLCDHCNRALGGFKDSPERLKAAATYLRSHQE